MKALQVGIIGVSVERGWAKESHVPAVQQLAGLKLAAVATNSQATAGAAAKAFGAKTAYASGAELIRDPAIDVVAITVRVQDHLTLVLAALAAGKHVYCEWPLGRNIAEAEQMSAAAQKAGVHAAIGLQTRRNAAALRGRELILSGAIGRVLTTRVYSSTAGFGSNLGAADLYLEDGANGASLVTIQGAHTLDLVISLLGGFAHVSALATVQYPNLTVDNSAGYHVRSLPDHLLVQARMISGAALDVEVAGGRASGRTPFLLEVMGDKGILALEGGAARGFQSGRLKLFLNGEVQPMDEKEIASLPDSAANVAAVYAALRDDIESSSSTAPDFDHAVRMTRLMNDVLSSSESGARLPAQNWPSS